jgi:hypothetical protein
LSPLIGIAQYRQGALRPYRYNDIVSYLPPKFNPQFTGIYKKCTQRKFPASPPDLLTPHPRQVIIGEIHKVRGISLKENMKKVLVILLMLAVIVYTVLNYRSGRIDRTYMAVCLVLLGLPMVNMIRLMIQDWKEK